MKTNHLSVILIFYIILINISDVSAQCAVVENAIEGITLTGSGGGTSNRSGLVYNPHANIYYSVNAGSLAYPIDTYSGSGSLLASPASGFDYRGAWWNPKTEQFEGNGFSTGGIFIQTLVAETSYPAGSGATIFTANQPDVQSVGDLDYINNEIIYYHNGFVHRYNRANNGFLGQFQIGNIPGNANINSNSIVFTGCEGMEYGVYDYTNRNLLLIDRTSGNVIGSSRLPETAPQRNSFGMSYANGLFWLFQSGSWRSYEVVTQITSLNEKLIAAATIYPNPVAENLKVRLNPETSPLRIQLSNLNGQIVYDRAIGDTDEINIDMKGYLTGAYLVKIISKETIETRKIMISR